MSLRVTAEADLATIIEDGVYGFGWPVVLTDPAGVSLPLTGFSNDIAQMIDPDTGQAVSGRLASVALRISTIVAAGFTLPKGIADSGSKPWVVVFNDINMNSHQFKIIQANPDRALGVISCLLELHK